MKKNYYQSPQLRCEIVETENLMVGGSKKVTVESTPQEQWTDTDITSEFSWD